MKRLFDENGVLNIADRVAENPTYKAIKEDGVFTDQELKDQTDATLASLHRLQELCSEEQQDAVLSAITDMSVLFAAYHHYELQQLVK